MAVQGVNATLITIEVNITSGVQFFLVGLPDNAVKESRERIVSALRQNGYSFPRTQVVINMAPADIKKEGAAYDLPMAIGVLAADEKIDPEKLSQYVIMGELSLDGSLQPIKGVLPIAIKAREEGFKGFILPKHNSREAAVVNNLDVYGVENIKEVVDFLNGRRELEKTEVNTREEFYNNIDHFDFDFSDVKGQENVKRAHCSRRRAQYYNDRTARSRKINDGKTHSDHFTTTHATRSIGNHQSTFRCR